MVFTIARLLNARSPSILLSRSVYSFGNSAGAGHKRSRTQ